MDIIFDIELILNLLVITCIKIHTNIWVSWNIAQGNNYNMKTFIVHSAISCRIKMNFYCIWSYSSSVLLFHSLKNLCNGVLLYLILLTVSWHIQFVVQSLQAFLFGKTKENDIVVIYCTNLYISRNVNHSFCLSSVCFHPLKTFLMKLKTFMMKGQNMTLVLKVQRRRNVVISGPYYFYFTILNYKNSYIFIFSIEFFKMLLCE